MNSAPLPMKGLDTDSILHDIGKFGMLEHIIHKPGNRTRKKSCKLNRNQAKFALALKSAAELTAVDGGGFSADAPQLPPRRAATL